jgi:hypothetical protein
MAPLPEGPPRKGSYLHPPYSCPPSQSYKYNQAVKSGPPFSFPVQASMSCISVSSLRGGGVVGIGGLGFGGISGFGYPVRTAFVGGRGMANSFPKVMCFRFSF